MIDYYLTKLEFEKLQKINLEGFAMGTFFGLCSVAVYFTKFLNPEPVWYAFLTIFLGLNFLMWGITLIRTQGTLYNVYIAKELEKDVSSCTDSVS